jgi:hypothetical protein
MSVQQELRELGDAGDYDAELPHVAARPARTVRLTEGPFRWLDLHEIPLYVLLVHVNARDVPPEVRQAITRELEVRLEDLLAWDQERRQK